MLKSHFNAFLECQVTVSTKLKQKKNKKKNKQTSKKNMLACKNYEFWKKKSSLGFWTPTLWMQVSCTTYRTFCAVVLNGMLLDFSPLLCPQPAAGHKLITVLSCSDKLKAGEWYFFFGIKQLICQFQQFQESYQHDRQTDGWEFSFKLADTLPFKSYMYSWDQGLVKISKRPSKNLQSIEWQLIACI